MGCVCKKYFSKVSADAVADLEDHTTLSPEPRVDSNESQALPASKDPVQVPVRDALDVCLQTIRETQYTKVDMDLLNGIWEIYDKDKSGALDQQELTQLIQDYSKMRKGNILNEMYRIIRGLQKGAQGINNTFERKLALAMATGLVEGMLGPPLATLERVENNSSQYALQLHSLLDENQDGNVVKDEFLKIFHSAWAKLEEEVVDEFIPDTGKNLQSSQSMMVEHDAGCAQM